MLRANRGGSIPNNETDGQKKAHTFDGLMVTKHYTNKKWLFDAGITIVFWGVSVTVFIPVAF